MSRQHEVLDLLPLHKTAQEMGFLLLLTNYFPSGGYCEADYANHFVVDEKCELHKCTVAFDSAHKVGSINDRNGATFNEANYARWLGRNPLEQPKCRECNILPLCAGGCAFNMLCSKGRSNCATVNDPEAFVQTLKLLYRNIGIRENRLREREAACHSSDTGVAGAEEVGTNA